MDAAKYISTLNQVAPPTHSPDRADFAVVDLAVDSKLLERIYGAMTHEPVQWRSLFEQTSWSTEWRHGPVLVDLRKASEFQKSLADQMTRHSIGLLLRSDWSMDELHAHFVHWIHDGLPVKGSLLRVQEPRKLGALLCVLGDTQRQALLNGASTWFWHDSHTWRTATPEKHEPLTHSSIPPGVSPDQLEAMAPYWLASEAQGCSEHYRESLAHHDAPEHWVLKRLLEGDQAGFKTSSHLERWLRLAILHGAGFHRRAPFAALLDEPQTTSNDRLSAMEGAVENQHAPV
ncbi:DUF4123 domain-containing protein [Marinobacter halodurans]|uniref:DUF4123 domain-containing protein n=1 Tax=Marinobacter halodurans TaxID=2528979 RepID=A0ABY1ZFD8_9GAMM|nr:DUF4123 domain-containing protein [Marinobacter halodurans]TBW46945.1 DUF4123 domain-containing protein [Marinobacter halodurans]